jgi:hypothetical protein
MQALYIGKNYTFVPESCKKGKPFHARISRNSAWDIGNTIDANAHNYKHLTLCSCFNPHHFAKPMEFLAQKSTFSHTRSHKPWAAEETCQK